jgi:hypothetical protein
LDDKNEKQNTIASRCILGCWCRKVCLKRQKTQEDREADRNAKMRMPPADWMMDGPNDSLAKWSEFGPSIPVLWKVLNLNGWEANLYLMS